MKKIGLFIPGFRSGVIWKKVLASIYYLLSIISIFTVNFWFFIFMLCCPYFWFGFRNLIKYNNNPNGTNYVAPVIVLFIVMLLSISYSFYTIGNDVISDITLNSKATKAPTNTKPRSTSTPETEGTSIPQSEIIPNSITEHEFDLTFKVPKSWRKKSHENGNIYYYFPDGFLMVILEETSYNYDNTTDIDKWWDSFLKGIKSTSTNYQFRDQKDLKLDNINTRYHEFAFDHNNQTYISSNSSFFCGNNLYTFGMLYETDNAYTEYLPIFMDILKTIELPIIESEKSISIPDSKVNTLEAKTIDTNLTAEKFMLLVACGDFTNTIDYYTTYDERTDPEGLLGQSENYIGKILFKYKKTDDCIIEIFLTPEDALKRYDTIKNKKEYFNLQQNYLIRISKEIPPEKILEIDEAFMKMITKGY